MSTANKFLTFLGIAFVLAVLIQVNWDNITELTMDDILGPEVPVADKYEYDSNGNVTRSHNFAVQGLSIVPLTILNEEQMKIQSEQGCIACHE